MDRTPAETRDAYRVAARNYDRRRNANPSPARILKNRRHHRQAYLAFKILMASGEPELIGLLRKALKREGIEL